MKRFTLAVLTAVLLTGCETNCGYVCRCYLGGQRATVMTSMCGDIYRTFVLDSRPAWREQCRALCDGVREGK